MAALGRRISIKELDIMLNPFKSLFNTYNERHAFIIGLSETLCPFPPRLDIPKYCTPFLITEYHYYTAGRACGFIALLALIIATKKLLWR